MFLQAVIFITLVVSIVFSTSVIVAKNKWKRLLAMALISSKIIVIIVLYALLNNAGFFLDVAIIYALLSYIGVIVLANYMLEWRKKL